VQWAASDIMRSFHLPTLLFIWTLTAVIMQLTLATFHLLRP
jgi:hypothetical protein